MLYCFIFSGIGVGSLFWNIVGLIFGWAYGRFGWFGISEQVS
jgi:hypothetical protein